MAARKDGQIVGNTLQQAADCQQKDDERRGVIRGVVRQKRLEKVEVCHGYRS
jgi:hypothetical protein